MSYILDALKRADAERERGKIPGLRAQPMPTTSSRAARSTAGLQRWVLFAAALLVAMLAAMVWQSRGPTPRGEAPVAAAPSPNSPSAIAPPPAAAPAPPSASAAATPPAPTAVVRAPATRRAPSAASPTPAPPEARIPAFAELPEDIKRQVPALAISGSIYSENPAQRMVTIGSQVFQEGDKPAPDLVLEQIGRKAAVFNFRGTRYSVTY